MPILGTTRDDKLELSNCLGLRTFFDLPKNTHSSVISASANLPPLFHQRLAVGYTSLGKLFAFSNEHPLSSNF